MEKSVKSCYFLSLTLENVACFGKKQKLNLTDKKGNPHRWTIILGDNGTGKTTLLRSLVSILPGENSIYSGLIRTHSDVFWDYKRGDKLYPFVEGRFIYNFSFYGKTNITREIRSTFEGISIIPTFPKGNSFEDFFIPCYSYSAARIMSRKDSSRNQIRIPNASLFSDNYPLIDAEEWLLKADYLAIKNKKYKTYKNQVEDIILNLLPDVSKIEYKIQDKEPQVLFKTSFGLVSLENLSLGYRTMLAWMVDFAAMLFERYPDSNNPLKEPAVLLVDEIDLHLHPKWQKRLVEELSSNFKKIQFIVSAPR